MYASEILEPDRECGLLFCDFDSIAVYFWIEARRNDWEGRGD